MQDEKEKEEEEEAVGEKDEEVREEEEEEGCPRRPQEVPGGPEGSSRPQKGPRRPQVEA